MWGARWRRGGAVVLVTVPCALILVAGSAVSGAKVVPTCLGMVATMVGTSAGETLNGTAGADVIVGLGGNDTINGGGGNDRLCGNDGNDTISGGPGNDQVQGGLGNDMITGGLGADVLKGGGGADNIKGNGGNDTLSGEVGNDTLNGDAGTDTVTGGLGTDTCYGEAKISCELPAPPPPPPEEVSFGNGTWMVGTDIPAGRYRMISDGTSCYWERLSGFGGSLGEIIANDFGYDTQIVDIEPADEGFGSDRCNTWSNDLSPRRTNARANWVSDGHLLVGNEIAAGTWRNSGMGDHCYWERLRGFSGQLGDIISNDFTDSPSVVTIAASDIGFYADSDCGTWRKTG